MADRRCSTRLFGLGLVVVAGTVVTPGTASADQVAAPAASAVLPHGIHLGKNGRYYKDACDHGSARYCHVQRLLPETYKPGDHITPNSGQTGDLGGMMAPTDILAAYTIPATSKASGQIVAIVDLPDATAYSDLTTYRAQFGLSALPQCATNGGLPDGVTPCFAVVDENGNPNPTGSDGGEADLETSLDMEMISATCPDCSILFVAMTDAVATGGPQDQDFVTSVATAAKLGAVATSISFGGGETPGGGDPTGYTTPGHLVFASSGDTGYLLEGTPQQQGGGVSPSYPASCPDVLGVGGTNLISAGNGTYTEVVWNDQSGAASSGCSTEFQMPAFQSEYGASKFGSCTQRASTDVSAASQFTPPGGAGGGIAIYSSGVGWTSVVGTSAASPIVAAAFVRMGIAAQVSMNLGFVYTHATAFNDVTSGTNDNGGLCQAGDIICTAAAGWDGPTGVGTPSGNLAAFGDTTSAPPPAGADAGGAPEDAGAAASPSTDAGAGPSPGNGNGEGNGATADSGASAPTPYPSGTGTGAAPEDAGSSWLAPSHEKPAAFGSTSPHSGGCASAPSSDPVSGSALWLLGVVAGLAVRRRRA